MGRKATGISKKNVDVLPNIIDTIDLPLETEWDAETNQYIYAQYIEENHCIIINFNAIFQRDDLKEHSIFKINRKYYKLIERIVDDLNFILNSDNDSARMLCAMNMKIAIANSKKRDYSQEEFFKDSINFVNEITSDAKELIRLLFVPSEVTPEKKASKRVNEDLQITPEMNETFLVSALIDRCLIPVLSNYLLYFPKEKIIYKLFREVMITIDNGTTGALCKLTKIINSRICTTKYINTPMWIKLFNNQAKDTNIQLIELKERLLEGIFPGIKADRTCIQFIDVVVRRQLEYLFKQNFKDDYKPLKNLDNDDDSDERDRINETSIFMNKYEDKIMLNRLTIKQCIDKFMKENDYTEKEYKEFLELAFGDTGKNVNNIQNFFMNIYFGKTFKFDVANEDQRKKLLWVMCEEINDAGMTELVYLLTSVLKDNQEIIKSNKSIKIFHTSLYSKIIGKYKDTSDIIERDNFVFNALSFRNYIFLEADTKETVKFDNKQLEHDILLFFLSYI